MPFRQAQMGQEKTPLHCFAQMCYKWSWKRDGNVALMALSLFIPSFRRSRNRRRRRDGPTPIVPSHYYFPLPSSPFFFTLSAPTNLVNTLENQHKQTARSPDDYLPMGRRKKKRRKCRFPTDNLINGPGVCSNVGLVFRSFHLRLLEASGRNPVCLAARIGGSSSTLNLHPGMHTWAGAEFNWPKCSYSSRLYAPGDISIDHLAIYDRGLIKISSFN